MGFSRWMFLRAQLMTLMSALSATPQCSIEVLDEGMTVDWLAEEGDGTGCHCTPADSLFGKGGDEDDRYARPAYDQLVLELHSAHSQHLHVRNDARGIIQLGRAKELLRGSEHARPIAERPNKATHCSSDGIIIVDDGDDRSSRQNTDPCNGSAIDRGCRAKLNMECQQRLQSHTEVYCSTPSLSKT